MVALLIVSSTVLLPTPQVLAVSRRLWLHDQIRRRISLVFRMVTLSLGITPSLYSIKEGRIPVGVTPRLHSHFTLAGLLRNGGRNQIGMVAGFPSERWPLSRRNGGRIRPEYAIITEDVPMLDVYWRRVLSDIGSNCSAPHWRSPMVLVSNFGTRNWPGVNELDYSSGGATRQRNLVQLMLKSYHPFFERDLDPWRLQTAAPPVNQSASLDEKRATWKRLPRPKDLNQSLHFPDLVDKLRGRYSYSKTDPLFNFVPPLTWNPFSVTKRAWREGKCFPEKTVLYKRRSGTDGYLDRGGRIWVWHDEKSHWDVQFDDGDSHINVSYLGKNLSI
jgi:hypothetical protein